MPRHGVDISGLEFGIENAASVERETWEDAQLLARRVFTSAFPNRSRAEIDYFTDAGDIDAFIAGHQDPAYDMERGRLRDGQMFARPLLVTARENGQLVGYAYSADNTSGAKKEMKMSFWLPKRYAWQRSLIVDEASQGYGVGSVLGYLSLEQRFAAQPASAYVIRDAAKANALEQVLVDLRMERTGMIADHPFSEAKPENDQDIQRLVRFQGKIAHIMRNVVSRPGMEEAIAYAKQHTGPKA